MGAKVYKYIGPDIVPRAFAGRGTCTFKCSLPRDFNDPFELFLTIDYRQDPDVLAYYREAIGSIPQRATTCFSTSPEVIPMWAHYAQNHTGVVLEVDEDCVGKSHPEAAFPADNQWTTTRTLVVGARSAARTMLMLPV